MLWKAGEIRRLPSGGRTEERVIYIHGLLLNGYFLYPLAKRIAEKNGTAGILYDYPTRRTSIRRHGENLAAFIEKEAQAGGKIHFVTHSMGGLLLRFALRKLSGKTKKTIGRTVMIAPPNKGSEVADLVLEKLFFAKQIVKCLPDLSSHPQSFANTFPEPDADFEIGIIGGTHDRKVTESSTHLNTERDHLMLPYTHTAILFYRQTAEQTASFLRHGKFQHQKQGKRQI